MLKRLLDMLAATLGLVLLSPLLLGIALWIKLDSPGPVFFRQTRIGRHGRPFRIFKFRTMCVNAERDGKLTVGADQRITRSGAFLRRHKLDELPQLIDVLRGTMSLVGPRPEVPEYVDLYPSGTRETVLSVRPGITDHASIEMADENAILAQYDDPEDAYRNVILPRKLRYYEDYARNHSIIEDLRILVLTLKRILGT